MRSVSAVGILIFLFLVSSKSYALIQNNVILTTDYSICTGAKSPRIVGASPTGGTIPYSFQWIVSTTDSMSGFTPGPGISDGINYIPPLFTVTTWFRRVVMSAGDADTSAALTVTVLPFPHPSAGYIVNQAVQCFTGHFYAFTDTSSVTGGSLVSHIWDFGDVTYSSVINPTKVFSGPFNYNVKLVVITDHGCRDSMIRTMSVLLEPEADFACDSMEQCFAGNSFLLMDASTITMGSLTSHWYFDDGTDSVTNSLKKSYLSPGTHTVKMVSVTDFNCKDSVSKTITVHPNPQAGFSVNNELQCLAGNHFMFTDTSLLSTGQIAKRLWDFGNGDTASGPEASISYNSAALYPITLIAQSEHGCSDTLIRTVSVNPDMAVGFTIANDSQCLQGNSFSFQDTSVAQNRIWHFSNGDTSTASDPVVSFAAAGMYTITLVSSNISGCTDSVTQTVVVHPQPATNIISGSSAVFKGYENVYAVIENTGSTYKWMSLGGTISSSNDTSVVSILWGNSAGTGAVKVIETSRFGCLGDTGLLAISINEIPDSLNINPDTLFVLAGAVNDSFLVNCNTSWTISHSTPWITIDSMSGTGNRFLHIFIAANTGPQRKATVEISTGSVSRTFVVVQSQFVGMEETKGMNAVVYVYPNPSNTGVFTLQNESNKSLSAALFDITGKQVNELINITAQNHQLDYSVLAEGVYMLMVSSDDTLQHIRLVIAK